MTITQPTKNVLGPYQLMLYSGMSSSLIQVHSTDVSCIGLWHKKDLKLLGYEDIHIHFIHNNMSFAPLWSHMYAIRNMFLNTNYLQVIV